MASSKNYELLNTHELTALEILDLRENFQKFDINGDGDIDEHELAVIMETIGESYTQESLRKILSTGDTDGDGKLSFQEFLSLVHHSKTVSYNKFNKFSFASLIISNCKYCNIFFSQRLIVLLSTQLKKQENMIFLPSMLDFKAPA